MMGLICNLLLLTRARVMQQPEYLRQVIRELGQLDPFLAVDRVKDRFRGDQADVDLCFRDNVDYLEFLSFLCDAALPHLLEQ